MDEKELAIQFAKDFNNSKKDKEIQSYGRFETTGIPHFSTKYPNIDVEKLNQELKFFNLTIKPANQINSKSKKFWQKEWDKSQTYFIFYEADESNL